MPFPNKGGGGGGGSSTNPNSGIVGVYNTLLVNKTMRNTGLITWMPRPGVFDNTAVTTFQFSIASPVPVVGVQFVFRNNNASASPTVNSCSVSNPLSWADCNNSGGTWVQGTMEQNTSFDWECPQGNGGVNVDEYTVTDIMRLTTLPPSNAAVDGIEHIITGRATIAAFTVAAFGGLPVGGDATTVGLQTGDNYANWATRPTGKRIWRHQTGNFAAAGTQSGFTDTTNRSQSPFFGIIIHSRNRIAQFVSAGDSKLMAAGATYRDDNHINRVANLINDPNGIGACHAAFAISGIAGNGFNGFYRRTADFLLRNDLACDFFGLAYGTPNDALVTITPAIVDEWSKNVAADCELMLARGVDPLLRTLSCVAFNTRNWSTDNSTPASDLLRVAMNTEIMKMNQRGIFVADMASLVQQIAPYNGQEQPLSNTQNQASFGYPYDGIHEGDAIYDAEAQLILPYVKRRIGI